MKMTDHRRRTQRGSQLVEFALVLPLLLLIVLLVTEAADAVRTYQIVSNSAREAARLSSLHHNKLPGCTTNDTDCTCGDACVLALLQNAAIQYAKNNGLDTTNMTVQVDQNCSVPVGGSAVTCASGPTTLCAGCLAVTRVTVTYPYTVVYLPRLPGFRFSNQVNLQAQSLFRNLY